MTTRADVPKLPTRIGRYTVVRPLSEARTLVLEVEDEDTGARFALKWNAHAAAGSYEGVRARNERRALHEIRSVHVLRVLDAGEHRGAEWIAMPLIDGVPVDRFVDTEPIVPLQGAPPDALTSAQQLRVVQPERIARVIDGVAQAARALDDVHTCSIVNRDVNPAHLLVDRSGHLWLLDFSLATRAPHKSEDGLVVGAFKYLAPEQALCGVVDERADLYSLGLVLYELLAGRGPFYAENSVGYAYHHARKAPPPVTRFSPDAPPALVALTHALIEKDPTRRPAHAREVLRVLEELDPVAASGRARREATAIVHVAASLDDEGFVPPGG